MYRILLAGSRDLRNAAQPLRVLSRWWVRCPGAILVHGGCDSGADQIANRLWRSWGGRVEVHPADWSLGLGGGPIRNRHMVKKGADVALMFPLPGSRGTLDCGRAAEEAGIPTWWFYPDRIIPALHGPQSAYAGGK